MLGGNRKTIKERANTVLYIHNFANGLMEGSIRGLNILQTSFKTANHFKFVQKTEP